MELFKLKQGPVELFRAHVGVTEVLMVPEEKGMVEYTGDFVAFKEKYELLKANHVILKYELNNKQVKFSRKRCDGRGWSRTQETLSQLRRR